MEFSQIQHCSLVVQSLERAAAFYREVLGLTEIEIPSTFKPAGLNVRWFCIGAQQIHILEGAETQPNSQYHLALQVDDAQAVRLWMKEKGIEIHVRSAFLQGLLLMNPNTLTKRLERARAPLVALQEELCEK